MKQNRLFVLVLGLTFSLLTVSYSDRASAVSQSLNATISINAGCVSTINGSTGNATTSVVTGNDISITILNSELNTGQNVSGPGITGDSFLTRDGKEMTLSPQKTFNLGVVSGPITLTFTPVPSSFIYEVGGSTNCPLGANPVSSSLTINTVDPPKPAAAKTPTPSTTQAKPSTTSPTQTTKTAIAKDNTPPVKTTQSEPELTAPQDQAIDSKTPLYVWVAGAVGLVAVIALIVASAMGKVPYRLIFNRLRLPFKK